MPLPPLKRTHVVVFWTLLAALLLLMLCYGSSVLYFAPPSPVLVSEDNTAALHLKHDDNDASSSQMKRTSRLTKELYQEGHLNAHPELCPNLGEGLRLLVLVTSAPAHASARDGIRLTWGHYALRTDVAIGFVLGMAPLDLEPALADEDALYGDLIRGNFWDSYSNLTLKTLSMLEWTDTYCTRVPRLLKTDDDMFINMGRLLGFVARTINDTRTIWGRVLKGAKPMRQLSSKYYMSKTEFPAAVYPNFATGPAYLMTNDTVGMLYETALNEPFMRLEDVFLTGVVATRLGIHLKHVPEFYNTKKPLNICTAQNGITVHAVTFEEQFNLWRMLLDGKQKCNPRKSVHRSSARAPRAASSGNLLQCGLYFLYFYFIHFLFIITL